MDRGAWQAAVYRVTQSRTWLKCLHMHTCKHIVKDFSGGSDGKESARNAGQKGDEGSIPALGRFPGGGNDNPVQYFLPGKSHGQRSLVGYSPWGHKELDTTEQLSTPRQVLICLSV